MTSIDGPYRGRHQAGAVRVSHGLHKPADFASDLPAWQLVLPPSGRFTHLTAAAIYGWWLPPLPPVLPVLAAASEADSRPQRAGVVVSRHRTLSDPVVVTDVLVDPPADVLLACARDLRLLDMIVLIDAALHVGSCKLDELRAAAYPRRRGAPMLRRAVERADERSESGWETLLRVFHKSVGVEVEPQYRLLDEHGVLIARADLRVAGTNSLHEYDGADHLDRRRQRKDLQRERRIGNEQWIRRGYTSADVLHQSVTILRDIDLAVKRVHRPERVRVWHRLLADSCFTPSGQERLRRRFGLADDRTHQRPLAAPGTGDDVSAFPA